MEDLAGHSLVSEMHELACRVSRLTGFFPSACLRLLAGQLESASYAVGAVRTSSEDGPATMDVKGYLHIARSCIVELEYQLILAREGALPHRCPYDLLCREVAAIRSMLAGILRRARRQ